MKTKQFYELKYIILCRFHYFDIYGYKIESYAYDINNAPIFPPLFFSFYLIYSGFKNHLIKNTLLSIL